MFSNPLWLIDSDGLRAGPAGDPDPDLRWKPDPRDWYPEPAPDGKCMLMCVVLKTALGTGLGEATRSAGNFAQGSSNGAIRVAGAIGSFGANAMGRTPGGQMLGAGVTMAGCEALCRKPKQCEIPNWGQGYQNMPLPSPFPR